MHVGIHTGKFLEWGGGVDFLRLIIQGLKELPDTQVTVVYIPYRKSLSEQLKDVARTAMNKWYGRNRFSVFQPAVQSADKLLSMLGIANIKVQTYDGPLSSLEAFLQSLKVDVLLPCFVPPAKMHSIPWVGYLYDVQHKQLPHLFGDKELQLRDHHFQQMLDQAKVIIVNARAVRSDLQRYYKAGPSKIVSLPFCPLYQETPLTIEPLPDAVPERYFLICNQFWQHKDHLTAFRAIRAFLDAGGDPEIKLVCTGKMEDYRNPAYMQQLHQEIQQLNLEQHLVFLGYVSKALQQSLMAKSLCLIQPTLFEGGPGGGSVYEALAMGQMVLLSDIPVNTEITDTRCTFFKTGNPDDLAQKMLEHQQQYPLQKVTAEEIKQHRMALALALNEAIASAMQKGAHND